MKFETLKIPIPLVLFALASPTASAQMGTQPNVLFIIVDDLRPEIGTYGDEVAHTPNIDRLAASGFLFENAFAVVPVCGASRAALLSGRKPTTNRFLSYDARLDHDLPDAPSLPGYFKDHGYHTLANGKVFDVSADSADVWSEPLWNPEGEWTSSVRRTARHEDLQKAYLDNPTGVKGPPFERLDVDDADYPDGKLADKTVADLNRLRNTDVPFFLAVGFRKPHLPFNAPDKYWKLYDPAEFALPSTYRDTPDGVPFKAIHNSPELRNQYAGIPAEGLLKESDALNLIHAYHAAVSYADAQVGKVLDALEEYGFADVTIVVLIGDHGWNLGEHTMWTKHNLFDVALRAPMIIRDPNRENGRISAVVDFLDIFPTLTELASLPTPIGLDGASLVTALDDPSRAVKPASFSRWFDGESVRTAQFRYTEWRDEADEVTARMLYDLSNDPEETRNVAEVSAYEEVVLELSARITANDSNSPWSPSLRKSVFYRHQ
ncbi:MAG: sulfatase [Acidobacteriota bacterium]|nr:MAG: sulfatase [Acidobacteriota bacterium]